MEKINISEKFRSFDKYWQSKMVGELNGLAVKAVKMKGEFEWHLHSGEDELYLVLKGNLGIEFKKETLSLSEGEIFIVARGNAHRLSAPQEVHLLIVEPKSTTNMEAQRTDA